MQFSGPVSDKSIEICLKGVENGGYEKLKKRNQSVCRRRIFAKALPIKLLCWVFIKKNRKNDHPQRGIRFGTLDWCIIITS